MANWNQPALTDTYANFLAYIDARLDDLALGLDSANTTVTNQPTNSIRWSSGNSRWEKYNGTSWVALSSLYAINISGNAATATALATARAINGVNFDGSAAITITSNTTQALTFSNAGSGAASGTTFNGGTARTISYNSVGAPKADGTGASGTWAIDISGNAATATSATSAGSCTGNAATVTNGVYTTGDQNIGGIKTFSGGVVADFNKSISLATGFNMFHDGAGAYFDMVTGNLAVRDGATVRFAFYKTSGIFTASGDITANSDERLKTNWRNLPSNFIENLAGVRHGIFDRIDTGKTQAGVSAQSLRSVLPNTIVEGADGMLSVNYGNAALVAAIALAREVVSLRRELNELKGA